MVETNARQDSTELIQGLRAGDESSAQVIVDEYMPLLIRIARRALLGARREVSDEEDVVQSALRSFFRASKSGKFPDLANRTELRQLLRSMTVRKAIDLLRRQNAARHGGHRIKHESVLSADDGRSFLDSLENGETPPDAEATVQESFRSLLADLKDVELEQIALAKLDGSENAEIAAQLQCSLRTVERRLRLIRKIWDLKFKETQA